MTVKSNRLSRRAFLLASGAATLGINAVGSNTHAAVRPNVIWIVNDASRARNYSCYGYSRNTSPNIDRLAKHGVLFEKAYSPAFWTPLSLAAYMTGRYFGEWVSDICRCGTGFLLDDPKDEILAPRAFSTNGYRTYMATNNGGWGGLNARLGAAFEQTSFAVPYEWGRSTRAGTPFPCASFANMCADALAWIERESRTGDKPFFMYLHGMETHAPFVIPKTPPFNQWIDEDYVSKSKYVVDFTPQRPAEGDRADRDDIEFLRGLYDGCILHADHHIAQFVDRLEAMGLLANTILVYTSDHGEALFEDGVTVGHREDCAGFDESHHIPLVMVGPGISENRRVSEPVSSVSILPTLMELCHLHAEGRMDGRSLVADLSGRPLSASAGDYVLTKAFAVPEGGDGTVVYAVGRRFKCAQDASGRREQAWLVPDSIDRRIAVDSECYEEIPEMRRFIEESAAALIAQAKKELVPRAMLMRATSLLAPNKGQFTECPDENQLEAEERPVWGLVAQGKSDKNGFYACPAAGAPVLELRYPFLPRGAYHVCCELSCRAPSGSGNAPAIEIRVGGSAPVPVKLDSSTGDWHLVHLGVFQLARPMRIQLKGAGSPVRLRRILVCSDVPGALKKARQRLLQEDGSDQIEEREKQLKALGYL